MRVEIHAEAKEDIERIIEYLEEIRYRSEVESISVYIDWRK